ncbi:hypothetical protein [Streptomyces sp. NPDC085937]|uniref:hypothetical protein n=1 Tax=Streptomyces sp. NPDC085937 TaxID=3365742 RepID=UPI0037D295C3
MVRTVVSRTISFWSRPHAPLDTMEEGIAVGEGQGGGPNDSTSNRWDVFDSAHRLSRWLYTHAVE